MFQLGGRRQLDESPKVTGALTPTRLNNLGVHSVY